MRDLKPAPLTVSELIVKLQAVAEVRPNVLVGVVIPEDMDLEGTYQGIESVDFRDHDDDAWCDLILTNSLG